jgi:hypothetical protein
MHKEFTKFYMFLHFHVIQLRNGWSDGKFVGTLPKGFDLLYSDFNFDENIIDYKRARA